MRVVFLKGHGELTFPRICVSKSQTVLFASCLSPVDRKFKGDGDSTVRRETRILLIELELETSEF